MKKFKMYYQRYNFFKRGLKKLAAQEEQYVYSIEETIYKQAAKLRLECRDPIGVVFNRAAWSKLLSDLHLGAAREILRSPATYMGLRLFFDELDCSEDIKVTVVVAASPVPGLRNQ